MAKTKVGPWLQPDGLLLIEGWARRGLTMEEIAAKMDINPDTLYRWQKKYPALSESLKNGKDVADTKVENALYKRAIGYTFEEVKTTTLPDGSVRVERTTKEVTPDTTAQIFWLKNRRPQDWRDKREIKSEATVSNNLFDAIKLAADKATVGIDDDISEDGEEL